MAAAELTLRQKGRDHRSVSFHLNPADDGPPELVARGIGRLIHVELTREDLELLALALVSHLAATARTGT